MTTAADDVVKDEGGKLPITNFIRKDGLSTLLKMLMSVIQPISRQHLPSCKNVEL